MFAWAQPDPGSEPAIWTEMLEKRFGRRLAVAGLTLSVPRGRIFGFLGPNGAGKTTVVKLLLGLVRPTGGEGMVLGARLGDVGVRRQIGYLPEHFRYQEWLSAEEVLLAHAALSGLPRPTRSDEVERVLELVGLSDRARDRVATFSKGMQQRLGTAVSLLGRPQLVFLDEPTSALDPVGRHDVREIVGALGREGVTVFLNSHLLSEVEAVCDGVAVIDKGRVIAAGRLEELLRTGGVRMEVEGLSDEDILSIGAVRAQNGWIDLPGLARDGVPDCVDRIVAIGGRVFQVEQHHTTLEEQFLRWMEDS